MKNQDTQERTTRDAEANEIEDKDMNRDPITGEPGSHPVGTGVGAAGGAAAGAAMGAIGGPVGSIVGGTIGAIAGGLAGKGIAENIDPTEEENHWESQYRNEPYYREDRNFEDYRPAYRLGVNHYSPDGNFNDMEPTLGRDWQGSRGSSRLEWPEAKEAARASWDRIHLSNANPARK